MTLLFFLFFFFIRIAGQSFAHRPKSQLRPNAEGQMRQRMHSARWFPHEQGSVPVKDVNSLQKPPKNKALEKGSNLISTFKEKGGLSLYQSMLQHISVLNLFVEGLIKKLYLLSTLKTWKGKN